MQYGGVPKSVLCCAFVKCFGGFLNTLTSNHSQNSDDAKGDSAAKQHAIVQNSNQCIKLAY